MTALNANLSIVPLLHLDGDSWQFLGTGSFIEPYGLLLTAYHVVEGHEATLHATTTENLGEHYPAAVVDANKDYDLALLWVEGYRPKRLFRLAHPEEIRLNGSVVCLEYGGTESRAAGPAYSAAARVGNVTRVMAGVAWMGPAGDDALELSFAALRGASGAPVLDNKRLRLWGVISANVAHHLMPAQTEQVIDDDGQLLSQTVFMLPQALAVNVQHVRSLLSGRL